MKQVHVTGVPILVNWVRDPMSIRN